MTNIYNGDVFDGPANVVVGPGTELPNFGGTWDINIGAESIDFSRSNTPVPESLEFLDQYTFTDLDWITPGPGSIIGLNLTTTAGTFNIQPTATFTADSVTVNFFGGTDVRAPLGLRVDLQVEHVPEPLTILGAGTAAGFGAFFKRQLNKQQKDKNKDKG